MFTFRSVNLNADMVRPWIPLDSVPSAIQTNEVRIQMGMSRPDTGIQIFSQERTEYTTMMYFQTYNIL